LFLGSFKPLFEILAASGETSMTWLFALSPFIMLFYGLIFAVFIGLAYAIVAVPVAFLHRYGLLKFFGAPGKAKRT
jgi:hypothetical protein